MRVWLVTVGEPLPCDGPNERLHRSGLLAESLASRGHEILWWSSTFDHAQKRFRGVGDREIVSSAATRIRLLHGPAYRRNVSLARLANHRAIGRRFHELAPTEPKPDVILASWPTIELSRAAVAYGRAREVPVVLDVRDLWPDIFVELSPPWARGLARLGASSMTRAARQAFGGAAAITGVTPTFVAWGLDHAARPASASDRAFPLGYSDKVPDLTAIARAKASWAKLNVGAAFVVAFVGTMGLQKLDMAPVIAAARALRGQNVQFVLCGDGDGLATFKAMSKGLDNVVFPGWVGWAEIWTLMRMASVGLAPYRNSLNYTSNLPNKPIEYLSAGLPILSSLKGTLRSLLSRHGCGITYAGADELVAALSTLRAAPRHLEAMSAAATALYRDKFVAEDVYDAMATHLEKVAGQASRHSTSIPSGKAVASW